MAQFHILSCRRVDSTHTDFEVRLTLGSLAVGDRFRCYDTHHPVDYRIERIDNHDDRQTLHCDGWIGFDEQFTEAILDTEQSGRPAGFRYPPMPK